MKTEKVSRILLGFVGIIVFGVMIAAPLWAYQWYQQPFLGIFLEPNNVVAQMGEDDWPATAAGVEHLDRLLSINTQEIKTPDDLIAILRSNQYTPVSLTLQRADYTTYSVTVQPGQMKLRDLLIYFILPYVVGLVFFISGAWVYWVSGQTHQPANAFFLLGVSSSVFGATFFDMQTTRHLVALWTLSLPVIGGTLLDLAITFPQRFSFVKKYPKVRLIPLCIVAVLGFFSVKEILIPSAPRAYITYWGWGYNIIGVGLLAFLGCLVIRLRIDTSPQTRQQGRIIIFGAAIAFSPVLFLYLIPALLGQTLAFQVAVLFPPLVIFPITVAYSIIRYRLLDVDRFLSNALTYVLTTAGAVTVFYLLLTLLSFALQSQLESNNPLLIALYLLILVFALNPLRDIVQAGINRVFYRVKADYRQILANISRGLATTPNLVNTLELLDKALSSALSPTSFWLYLYNDDGEIYEPYTTRAHAVGIPIYRESKLVQFLYQAEEVVWLPPERPWPEELSSEKSILERLDCRVLVPLRYEAHLVGFLALGQKRSGEPYTSEDFSFLSAAANQSSLSVENVRLFTNLQKTLEQTLEMKSLMDDIFSSMSSGVITTDVGNKITLFNRAAERIAGISVNLAVGKSLRDVMGFLGPRFNVMAEATLSQDQQIVGEELTPVLLERGPLHLRVSCSPLRDARLDTKGTTIVIDDLTEQYELEAEQERIRQTFGRVVAPRVRDRLLADPSNLTLAGESEEITVLFADLHHFTPFSESVSPETLFEVLNSYLTVAAQAILDEEGTLDKFMGDAAMAFWNAPDKQPNHTLLAVKAALKMNQALEAHRSLLDENFQLYFSVGISRGVAMVGNVGTSELFNYTVIGSVVNLAQRLESVAEPSQILLSGPAYKKVAPFVKVKERPALELKGHENLVTAYELLGLVDSLPATP